MKTKYSLIIFCSLIFNLYSVYLVSQENEANTKREANTSKMFFTGGTKLDAIFNLKESTTAVDLDLGFGVFIFKFFAAGGTIDWIQAEGYSNMNVGIFGRFYLFKRTLIFGPRIDFDNDGNSKWRYELGTNLMITKSIGYEPKFIYSPDDDRIIFNLISFSLYL